MRHDLLDKIKEIVNVGVNLLTVITISRGSKRGYTDEYAVGK